MHARLNRYDARKPTISRSGLGNGRRVLVSAAAAALAIGGLTGRAHGTTQFFYAWSNANTDQAGMNFANSPFLDDSNAGSVGNQLAYSQAHGFPLAVKIRTPLTPGGPALQVFNAYNVQYVFLDLEGSSALSQTQTLVTQVHGSTKSGSAYIGNFNYYPNQNVDPTAVSHPAVSPYEQSGANMANAQLYPGSPDYRTPGASNNNHNVNAGGSTAPNIRSALFTLPIERLTLISNSLYGRGSSLGQYNPNTYDASFDPSGHTKAGLNLPWATRFNNYGNAALTNLPGTTKDPYRFNGTVDGDPTHGQLPSRGDFSAQILQYRMRGADSINLFLASVTNNNVAYTETQQQQDLNAGWNITDPNTGQPLSSGSGITNNIFASNHYGFANLSSLVRLDVPTTVRGMTKNIPAAPDNAEHTGIIWSGVYAEGVNNKPVLNSSTMSVILSNLSASSHIVDLGTVAGYSVYDPNSPAADKSGFNVLAGQHLLLTFTLETNGGRPVWDLATNTIVFTDNNRDGIGTPEPASIGLLGLSALGLLARRRRPSLNA